MKKIPYIALIIFAVCAYASGFSSAASNVAAPQKATGEIDMHGGKSQSYGGFASKFNDGNESAKDKFKSNLKAAQPLPNLTPSKSAK